MSERVQPSGRLTIALADTENGWVFRLHNDNHRAWLDSLATDAPVPLSFVAGAAEREFETAIGNSRGVGAMLAVARHLLPARIVVSDLDEIATAA